MRGINLLQPLARQRANQLMQACAAAGLNVLITDTLRTVEEQNALYAQGRAADGRAIGPTVTRCRGSFFESPHQWGVAFDFCRNEKGRVFDNTDGFFKKVGAIGKDIGLFWGGDFKGFVDMPHFELPEFLPHNSTDALIRQYGSPEAFIQVWKTQGEPEESPAAPVPVLPRAELLAEYKNILAGMAGYGIIADEAYWLSVLNGERNPDSGYLAELFRRINNTLDRLDKLGKLVERR